MRQHIAIMLIISMSVMLSAMTPIAVSNGMFIDPGTGKRFIPQGFNFTRLNPTHSTFDAGKWDAPSATVMLDTLQKGGFNVVRVFLATTRHASNGGMISASPENAIDEKYAANLRAFLILASARGIRTIITWDWIPKHPVYDDFITAEEAKWPAGKMKPWSGVNSDYWSTGRVAARTRFMIDVLESIAKPNASLLNGVFSIELRNESAMMLDQLPFTQTNGIYEWEGQKYEMGDERSRQDLADDVSVNWANRVYEPLKARFPGVLFAVNVYSFKMVGRTGPGHTLRDQSRDKRIPLHILPLAERSRLDYLDYHFYMHHIIDDGIAHDLEANRRSVEFDTVLTTAKKTGKPLILGEFGAFTATCETPAIAVPLMTDQVKRCLEGGFQGWLYWTYDTFEQNDHLFHSRDAGGAIFNALSSTALSMSIKPDGSLAVGYSAPKPKVAVWKRIGRDLQEAGDFSQQGSDSRWKTAWYTKGILSPEVTLSRVPSGLSAPAMLTVSLTKSHGGYLTLNGPAFKAKIGSAYQASFKVRSEKEWDGKVFFVSEWDYAKSKTFTATKEWRTFTHTVRPDKLNSAGELYVRFDITGKDGNLSISEVQVFEVTEKAN